MYDPFANRHNGQQNSKLYIRGLDKIDFIFFTYNLLKGSNLSKIRKSVASIQIQYLVERSFTLNIRKNQVQ